MIPKGTKLLFITCYSEEDKQFSGISDILRKLSSVQGSFRIRWQENSRRAMDLSSLSNIENIIISGHGALKRAAVTDNSGNYFAADSIITPPHAEYYLLCCFQGKKEILKQWADKLNIPMNRIRGCPSETETALSTLFFMHILKYGIEVLPSVFDTWCRMNQYLEPYFNSLRSLYRSTNGNPLKTIKTFTDNVDFSGFDEFIDFIDIAREYPEFLEGLS